MNGTDGFLDIHDSHLRVLDGNIHAKSIILDQLDITSSNITSSTVQFLNGVTAFKTTANVEIGTANLFVDTSTSNVGILTSTPTHTLDVRGTANVEVLRTSSNIEMNGGTFSLGGHMIPSVDNQYDIGSAENKIRDMYVSDNSLWIGDKAKISFDDTEDKLTFRKRKASDTFIPAKIIDLANASGEGLNTTISITNHILGKSYTPSNLGAMKLHHWLRYAKDFQSNIKLSEIFANTESDFDSTSTAEGTFSGTGAITVPSGTTAQQPTGVAGMVRFNSTSNHLEVYNGTAWQSLGGVSATGGTVTTSGAYKIHTFTSSGTLTVISGGEVEYLVVAGGGAGASTDGGGGGAGGVVHGKKIIQGNNYNIVVGDFGAFVDAQDRAGNSGNNSTALDFIALGGGGGGNDRVSGQGPKIGGSGGGGGSKQSQGQWQGASGTQNSTYSYGLGNNGGDGVTSPNLIAGGGGGAGESGKNGNDGTRPAGGGDGIEWPIGSGTYYGGGGGGGHNVNGTGGQGGGGSGSSFDPSSGLSGSAFAVSGSPNTGGGGGGGGGAHSRGASGGSGIVIIRYLQ